MLFNIEPKEIINPDGISLGTATIVMLRILQSEADEYHIVPGYFEYRDSNGQIHPDARGNMAIDITEWEDNRDGVFNAF